MSVRRLGSKGNEWLLIHKKDEFAKSAFNIDKLDYSVLTQRSLDEIASGAGSAEWQSNRAAATNKKSSWLADKKKVSKRKANNQSSVVSEVKPKRTKAQSLAM
jgi:hypothetical protein